MPGWSGFKTQVKAIMESYPMDYDTLPSQLAKAYDLAMKVTPAGDLNFANPVASGNVVGMEALFKSIFLQQAVSPEQLPLIQLLSNGFIAYWTGATLAPMHIPYLAPVGATPPSIAMTNGLCTNPGTTATIPPFIYKGETSVDTFIDNFIMAADMHLKTVSGIVNVTALYGVPPVATAGPGILPWVGYTMDANSIALQNQILFDDAFLALGLSPDMLGDVPSIIEAYNAKATSASGADGSLVGAEGKPITDAPMTFIECAVQIIQMLEGGYTNTQNMVVDHPFANPSNKHYDKRGNPTNRVPFIKDKRYWSSGETMFGVDRVAGAPDASIGSKAARDFWALIDGAGAWTDWKNEYIPPDPLKTQLLNLAAQIQEIQYNNGIRRYVTNSKLKALIPTNGKLMFNFAYASWNGPGWFKGFSKRIQAVYEQGMTDPHDLAEYFVNMRVNNEGIIGNAKGGSAYSLIRQGGFKIAKQLGITPQTTSELWAANVSSKLNKGTVAV